MILYQAIYPNPGWPERFAAAAPQKCATVARSARLLEAPQSMAIDLLAETREAVPAA